MVQSACAIANWLTSLMSLNLLNRVGDLDLEVQCKNYPKNSKYDQLNLKNWMKVFQTWIQIVVPVHLMVTRAWVSNLQQNLIKMIWTPSRKGTASTPKKMKMNRPPAKKVQIKKRSHARRRSVTSSRSYSAGRMSK